MPSSSIFSILLFLLFSLSPKASGQHSNASFTSPADFFPQLQGLAKYPAPFSKLSLGGEDFDHCCLVAVNDSLTVGPHGTLIEKPDSFIGGSVQNLLGGQFPCGAQYNPGDNGAPVVTIPYKWCRKNCPGWSISSSKKLNQWVSPLAGFIVPAVVFCLAIPRRRKIYLFDEDLFDVPLNKLSSTPSIIFRAPIAAILVTIDTIVWLLVVFALAGPILLSGVFEALLDKRVLEYLQDKIENGRLTGEQRVRILYTILLGNLDMHSERGYDDGAWDHMNTYLIPRYTERGPGGTKTSLRAMLSSQYSFGVTVGAPVVFFGASFVYTLVEIIGQYGENDLSLALAFGEYMMVIPHIAVVSGLLLAGNNPNTLEGVVSHPGAKEVENIWGVWAPVYESCYMPAWIWNRGRSKKLWFERVANEFDDGDRSLHTVLRMTAGDWGIVSVIAYSLIVTPVVLAFLTAYYTVTVGLSCRSFTVLLYCICQACLLGLWVWDIQAARLHLGFKRRPSLDWKAWQGHRPSSYFWWTSVLICGAVAVFFAVGGTSMQVIGAYRNCLCLIPLSHWGSAALRDDFPIIISTDSREAILSAQTWWVGTGAGAVAFLGISSFIGWWYQRLVKFQMKRLIDRIDWKPEPWAVVTSDRDRDRDRDMPKSTAYKYVLTEEIEEIRRAYF